MGAAKVEINGLKYQELQAATGFPRRDGRPSLA
jgi:hypothetical protein